MTKQDNGHRVQEPGLFVFSLAVILGALVSFALATYLLKLSPAWVALLAGAVSGMIGFFLGENIGEALVLSVILGVLTFVIIKVGLEIEIVRTGIVPVATGFSVGKLVYGIWKEIS